MKQKKFPKKNTLNQSDSKPDLNEKISEKEKNKNTKIYQSTQKLSKIGGKEN